MLEILGEVDIKCHFGIIQRCSATVLPRRMILPSEGELRLKIRESACGRNLV